METLGSRNNTSFFKKLEESINNIKKDKNDVLRYHQRIVHEYVLKYPEMRGLLIYHKMGGGKTILSASISEYIIDKTDRQIIFIASKSLHDNFANDVIKYRDLQKRETPKNYVKDNYDFVSLNASNMIQQVYKTIRKGPEDIFSAAALTALKDPESLESIALQKEMKKLDVLGNLDNTVVIIDEAHNFFNSITNGSKNAMGLYHLLMKAKNIKILFLTGSPITNDPFEAAVCFNMCSGTSLFGDDYESFSKYFIHDFEKIYDLDAGGKINLTIKNKDTFINRIAGLVSYYGADSPEEQKLFPKQYDPKIEKIAMSSPQYAAYITARDKELEESKRSGFRGKKQPLQKPQGASSSYRVRSRQISNYLYPEYASRTYRDARGYQRYEKYLDKLEPRSFEWSELNKSSAKICQLLQNCKTHTNFLKKVPSETKSSKKAKKKTKGGQEIKDMTIFIPGPQTKKEITKLIEKHDPQYLADLGFETDDLFKQPYYIIAAGFKKSIISVALIKRKYKSLKIKDPSRDYLIGLFVHPGYRRKGIGSILLKNVLNATDNPINVKINKKWNQATGTKQFFIKHNFVVFGENKRVWLLTNADIHKIGAAESLGVGPGIIYSQFVDSGVGLLGKILEHYGMKNIKSVEDAIGSKPKEGAFAIISGDVPPDVRTELLKIFRSKNNIKGDVISLLLITATGAEGITTKNVRHVHALEPYWHWARMAQLFARAVRMYSHVDLPLAARTVQPYIYLSDYPTTPKGAIAAEAVEKQKLLEETTDVNLYNKSVSRQILIDSFLKAIQSVSIDCLIHSKDKSSCHRCAPTDEPLFLDDLDKDIKTPSACQPITEEKVKAKSVKLDDKEYMYSVDKSKPPKIHIFELDPSLGGYIEIMEDHPDYFTIRNAIAKREKIKI